ncbi:TIGR04104 family putative zinc finger protein [Salimicrobium sp. PL1-032A]|uniref:TIGR04104 family putative zinc finger protein n=1 Tax=Salimicrobium sp. PL1-032A TaxID=3095364 RepID=UPI00326092A3
MPICENCKYTWTWKETVQKSFRSSLGMNCPHCCEKQYWTLKSKKVNGLLPMIVPLVMLAYLLLDLPAEVALAALFLTIPLIMTIQPFLVDVRNEDEMIG